jgi:NodT family efflux transporter outer membrane factor (OMF) lipoprotein
MAVNRNGCRGTISVRFKALVLPVAWRPGFVASTMLAAAVLSLCGCGSLQEYVCKGFKVGPNYCRPDAPVAEHWIDEADIRVQSDADDLTHWWTVFNDPVLNSLIQDAYQQNLTLREAGIRIFEARDQLGIVKGNLFPQQQDAFGSYKHTQGVGGGSSNAPTVSSRVFDNWSTGFSLAWELDFWGRFRRAILSAEAQLDRSVEDYDAALVTLLGDVATNYVQMRQSEQQIEWARANVKLQTEALGAAQDKLDQGLTTDLDTNQARANLRQTEAQIPLFEIAQRQASNRICILLGMPPAALQDRVGAKPIPTPAPDVAVLIPAQLLQRRPDVRRAERDAAAQAQQIGIAQAALYPAISISGTMGYSAAQFGDLFSSKAFNGSVGPSFQWNVLNYGRLVNNVRLQDDRFRELVVNYQQTVLLASEEVEDGIISFLRSQQRAKSLNESVKASQAAVDTAMELYTQGQQGFDFNRLSTLQQDLVVRQDALAQARGQIAQGLIQIYRGLGGGWEIRLNADEAPGSMPAEVLEDGEIREVIPTPAEEEPAIPKPAPKPAAKKPPQARAPVLPPPQPAEDAAAEPDLSPA